MATANSITEQHSYSPENNIGGDVMTLSKSDLLRHYDFITLKMSYLYSQLKAIDSLDYESDAAHIEPLLDIAMTLHGDTLQAINDLWSDVSNKVGGAK